jgi:hypothetical protein
LLTDPAKPSLINGSYVRKIYNKEDPIGEEDPDKMITIPRGTDTHQAARGIAASARETKTNSTHV